MEVLKRREHEDDYVQTILFTAGTFFVMACFKQAIAVSLIQQWRAWMFLVLNIVLLAIAFTSCKCPTSTSSKISQETKSVDKESSKSIATEAVNEECYYSESQHEEVKNVVVEEINDGCQKLPSPEELHERAEAFITMFRQQLVKDARKGREHLHGGAERYSVHAYKKMCPRQLSLKG